MCPVRSTTPGPLRKEPVATGGSSWRVCPARAPGHPQEDLRGAHQALHDPGRPPSPFPSPPFHQPAQPVRHSGKYFQEGGRQWPLTRLVPNHLRPVRPGLFPEVNSERTQTSCPQSLDQLGSGSADNGTFFQSCCLPLTHFRTLTQQLSHLSSLWFTTSPTFSGSSKPSLDLLA